VRRTQWLSLVAVLAVMGLLTGCSKQAQVTEIQDQLVAVDGQTWVVGAHLVTVSADASVSGTPSVGSRVGVSGHRTESGELVIDTVQVLADAQPAPAPALTARPVAPPSGQTADHGNQPEKASKGNPPAKGHKGN
jgi:hypothetical protein